MWRVHKNRTDRGLGGTWSPSGHHESMKQDKNMILSNASWSLEQIIDGVMTEQRFDNPFLRWHKSFGNYKAFLSDMDDHTMQETYTFERLKKFPARSQKDCWFIYHHPKRRQWWEVWILRCSGWISLYQSSQSKPHYCWPWRWWRRHLVIRPHFVQSDKSG